MRIIPPKSDVGFKELFENETVRKHFVSDVLSMPLSEIKYVRLGNTFLRRGYAKQKLGILDVLVELNNNTKINIEIQLKFCKNWDKRQVFYLSKMFTSNLFAGDKYERLKRCVSIAILDYNVSDDSSYHRIYRLRDETGNEFTDIVEIHIIELRKELKGSRIDDWIRLFNAKSEDDLDMIKTDNSGIKEAIYEVRRMSLFGKLKFMYEDYMKTKRDNAAIMDYAIEEAQKEGFALGMQQGIQQGVQQGVQQSSQDIIHHMLDKGLSPQEISDMTGISMDEINKVKL